MAKYTNLLWAEVVCSLCVHVFLQDQTFLILFPFHYHLSPLSLSLLDTHTHTETHTSQCLNLFSSVICLPQPLEGVGGKWQKKKHEAEGGRTWHPHQPSGRKTPPGRGSSGQPRESPTTSSESSPRRPQYVSGREMQDPRGSARASVHLSVSAGGRALQGC